MNTAKELMKLQDAIFDKYGLQSAPGSSWLIIELRNQITPELLQAITPADLDQLTANNYHTARRAAETRLQEAGNYGSGYQKEKRQATERDV